MKSKNICIITIFSLLLMNAFAQKSEWKLVKEKDGIVVYTREVGGKKIKEFKAETIINAQIPELVAMLVDASTYIDWIDKIEKAEIVEVISKNEFYVYTEADVPWPIENRDIVTLNKVVKNESTGVVTIEIASVTGKIPEKDGIIRMLESGGFWKFTPEKDGKTVIVYQYLADPGGGIPDWLVNMFLVDGPFKTLENMRRIAEKN